jgi:hypothetical protein
MNLQEIKIGSRVMVRLRTEVDPPPRHLGPSLQHFISISDCPATVTGIGDSSGDDGCDTPIYVEMDGHGPSAFPVSAVRPISS